ncbi:MAG TPA: FAD/NAD(P)-binding protein [Fimbriimonadaceae bacterium]|nr:FAD/NAD(P)-binding protein [Fimbriimonadaceae bacterium]
MPQTTERLHKAIDPTLPAFMIVDRIRRETADTFTIDLVEPDLAKTMAFLPGQFNMIGLPGIGEVPISISGDPESRRKIVHTIREVGEVTKALGKLKPGEQVMVRGPFGTSWPMEAAKGCDVILVAGGIGLAPLRPVIYSVMQNRSLYGRFVLLYGARTPEDVLFAKELAEWRSHFDFDLQITVDRAPTTWRNNVGVVSRLIPKAPFDPVDTVAMVCGPEVMIRYSVQELERSGVSGESIYLSMERNMKCGVGLCGHCQLRGSFICLDGPVYSWEQMGRQMEIREL